MSPSIVYDTDNRQVAIYFKIQAYSRIKEYCTGLFKFLYCGKKRFVDGKFFDP